jgi:chitin disaccharide deacetylase
MPMLLAPTPQRVEQARQAGIDALATSAALRQEGFLFLDTLNTGEHGDTLEARRESYYAALRNLPAGVTEIIVHLNLDDDEIRAVTSAWARRWHEYQIFTDPLTRALIDSLSIKLIGYKDLRGLFGQAEP